MWDALKDLTFDVIHFFYNVFGDWGAAIIAITLILRIILAPLMQKSTKSSYHMQKMQPVMQELQQKYKNDPQRLQEEMRKVYAESHFNPLSGCLPMFLQMPIFILLYQVLQEMAERTHGTTYEFYNLVPSLIEKPSQAFAAGFPEFIPYLILMLIFAGGTFAPMLLQQSTAQGDQKKQMQMMAAFMSIFMLWIGWGAPAGVLLYWGVSSIFALIQQQTTLYVLRKEDATHEKEHADEKPVKVEVVRKEKKRRPTKNH